MKKFGVCAIALTLFLGAATVSFAQGADSIKGTSATKKTTKKTTNTTKKTTKKKRRKKKSTGKKSTATKGT